MLMSRAPISLTKEAVSRVHTLLLKRGKPSLGIRVRVQTKGCSGLSYVLEYCDAEFPGDELVEIENIKLFIDSKALLFILGTQMDFEEDTMKSGFVFKNPNERGKCGCGKSFHV